MNKIKSNKGFTIIEVVLVLAIAGLIFLMVFVALPRLQVSQRDTQRRDDVAAVATAITQYQANNGGRLPTNDRIADFTTGYLTSGGTEFRDPSGDDYGLAVIAKTDAITNVSAVNTAVTIPVQPDADNRCSWKFGNQTGVTDYHAATAGAEAYCDAATVDVADGTFTASIYIVTGASCGEEGALGNGTGARSYAVAMRLEGSGYYCTDN